jgi:hypothetical protein
MFVKILLIINFEYCKYFVENPFYVNKTKGLGFHKLLLSFNKYIYNYLFSGYYISCIIQMSFSSLLLLLLLGFFVMFLFCYYVTFASYSVFFVVFFGFCGF